MTRTPTPAELAELFQSRYDLVVRVAQRFAPNAELARDIAQLVFMEFARQASRKNWDLDRDINPLLFGITKNVARRVWRQEKKHLPEALQIVAQRYLKGEDAEPDRYLEERIDELNRCIERLSTRGKRFIESHYFGGASMEEIARENSLKSDAVRQMFCRWRAMLRDCMLKEGKR